MRHLNARSQRSGLPHIGVRVTRGPRDDGPTATDYDNPIGCFWRIDGERFCAFGDLGQYISADPSPAHCALPTAGSCRRCG